MILVITGHGKTYLARNLTMYQPGSWRDDVSFSELQHNYHDIFKEVGAGDTVIICLDKAMSIGEKQMCLNLLHDWANWVTVCYVEAKHEQA